MNEDMKSVKTKIWITAKVRMISEYRRSNINNILWVIGLYYSFISLVIHLFNNTFYKDHYSAEFGALCSMVGLLTPLLSLGLDFSVLADKYRSCYLQLQKLLLDNSSDNVAQKYSEILDFFPNHTPQDYTDFVVKHTWIEGKSLTDCLDNPVVATRVMLLTWLIRKVLFWGLVGLVAVLPLIFLISPLVE